MNRSETASAPHKSLIISLTSNILIRRLALLVLLATVSLAGIYFARRSGADYTAYRNDFNVYYFASRQVAGGSTPYERALEAWTPYLYPPLLAELLIPLSLLPPQVASYLWFLISFASFAAAAVMSAELLVGVRGPGAPERRASFMLTTIAICAAVSVGRFALDTFYMGQVNNLVAGLAVAHVYLYAKHKKRASAIALALAASIKLTPVVLVFYHLARGRFRYAAGCTALAVALTLIGFAPFGAKAIDAFGQFVTRTVENGQGFDLSHAGNQSLRGLEARIAGESGEQARRPATVLTAAASAILLALAIALARAAPSEAIAAAPFFCFSVLASPLSWKGHFVILLLPAASLAREAITAPPNWKKYTSIGALAVAFQFFNLTSARVLGVSAANWAEAHSLILGGAFLIYFALIATWLMPPHRPG